MLALLQEAFRAHRRLNGVEHDPDGLRELFEEVEMAIGEGVHGRQFNDRLGLAFIQHRQHYHIGGPCSAEGGMDGRVILWHLGQEYTLLFPRALADEAVAELNLVGQILFIRVGGEALQPWIFIIAGGELIDRALL